MAGRNKISVLKSIIKCISLWMEWMESEGKERGVKIPQNTEKKQLDDKEPVCMNYVNRQYEKWYMVNYALKEDVDKKNTYNRITTHEDERKMEWNMKERWKEHFRAPYGNVSDVL